MSLGISIIRDNWKCTFTVLPFAKEITIGGRTAEIYVPGCPQDSLVHLFLDDLGYRVSAEQNSIIENCNGASAYYHIDESKCITILSSDQKNCFTLEIGITDDEVSPKYDRFVDIPSDSAIKIGRRSDCDIVVKTDLATDIVFSLSRKQDKLIISTIDPIPMGVYVNCTKITQNTQVTNGDFIFFEGFHACWHNGQLVIPSADRTIVRTLHYSDEKEQNSHLVYPQASRTSRRIYQRNTNDIVLLEPPPAQQQNKNNLLMSLLPTGAMILLTIVLRGRFSSDSSMLLFSISSLSIGAITSIITYIQTSKESRQKKGEREVKYHEYISQMNEEITKLRDNERDTLRSIYIDTDRELHNIESFSAELFDRHITDDDFLDVRLGIGEFRSQRAITYKKHGVFEPFDALYSLPEELERKYAYITDAPAYFSLKNANAVGIVGDKDKLREIFKIAILDLATRQYFEDVAIYSLLSVDFEEEAKLIRFLPHLQNHDLDRRNVSIDEEGKISLSEDLYKELSDRESYNSIPSNLPWLVIFIYTGNADLMHHPLMHYIEKASSLHAAFVFLTVHNDLLPQGCTELVRLSTNGYKGVISSLIEERLDRVFSYVPLNDNILERAFIRLAPVYSSAVNLSEQLKSNCSLFDTLSINTLDDLNIISNWSTADTTVSLSAPLGIMQNGGILNLDLHERAHGPHGLVAGTTGSGKSQVLISYILSLSVKYSPEDVNFCIIDFKGGDIIKHLGGLPHITGSITNLDKREISRSLKAINAEKNKRMRLFAEPLINASNINEYTKAFKEGKTSIPLPHLVIIVDEFAELKSQYPDFMQDLISIARVGRSLGIHLILCTQKPVGVVDSQIWGNSDFKLCLRVQTKEDSNEVLKSPLAAEIREPGRGYLQVGRTNQFELFQSGYSGASIYDGTYSDQDFVINELMLSGKKKVIYQHSAYHTNDSKSQCTFVLESIISTFKKSEYKQPNMICQPAIAETLPYKEVETNDLFNLPIGIYDDPDNQCIHHLIFSIDSKNTLIVGSSQMGKTNILMALLRRLASTMTAKDVQVYIMDFNSMVFRTMEEINIVGGVVTADEEERMKNLFKLLKEEVAIRKTRFIEESVTSFSAYRQTHADIPANVVFIDNYAVFKELYEEKYDDEISFLLREGPAAGITFCVTVQQIATLTYRKLYFFNQRVALPLNEQSEYSSVFEGCRIAPLEVPGRVLVSINKEIHEGQIYEAFSGQTEKEKNMAIRAFVYAHTSKPWAKKIPSIPTFLKYSYIVDNYPSYIHPLQYIYGMDYASVSPAFINLNDQFSITLVGSDEKSKGSFIYNFVNYAVTLADSGIAQTYILDDYRRSLRHFSNNNDNVHYTIDSMETNQYIERVTMELSLRLEKVQQSDDGIIDDPLIVIIINSQELLRSISNSAESIERFNTIANDYRQLKIFFLFANVGNKTVSYSSPDILRFIRDERNAIIFDDLGAMKLYDISLSQQREQSRPRLNNEAFYLEDEDVSRIKLIDTNKTENIVSINELNMSSKNSKGNKPLN